MTWNAAVSNFEIFVMRARKAAIKYAVTVWMRQKRGMAQTSEISSHEIWHISIVSKQTVMDGVNDEGRCTFSQTLQKTIAGNAT